MVLDQIDEALKANRTCGDCGNLRPIHDDRGRILDALYGRFRVNSPRLRQCLCQATSVMTNTVLPSPVVDLFPERAIAELMRLQAELGSRHSFREAARLIEMFLPCAPQSNTTVRNRLGRVAEKLDFTDERQRDKNSSPTSSPLTVFLDAAHIRCRPEYQKRHLDVVVGKVENANMSRRFGLVQQAAKSLAKQLRNDLIAQGWDDQSKVTVISDGEPALPNLVRRAVQGSVTHILDCWHISMRVKHIENAVKGMLQTQGFLGLPFFIHTTGRNTALVPLAWESDDRGDQSQTSHSRLQSLARRNQRPKGSYSARQSPMSGALHLSLKQLRCADKLWSSISKRPRGLIVPSRRLRGRHRKRPHGKTAAHAVVPARRALCCSHKGRRPRRQTDRLRHCRMNTKFCPLPDQVQTVFRPRRHKLSAAAYRQFRSNAHSIWDDITCELKAA